MRIDLSDVAGRISAKELRQTHGRRRKPLTINAPRRTRTFNPLIKSQLLCQLS